MKGGSAVTIPSEKIATFMHGIHEKLKAKIGEHQDLKSCVEHFRRNEKLQRVVCMSSNIPVDHLINKLNLLEEMALVAEKEMRENQLKLGHKGDHDTRRAYLVAYVQKEESLGELTDQRKREIKLLNVTSRFPEPSLRVFELLRLDEQMNFIQKEKEKLRAEMTVLQSRATEKAHELGEKAHELGVQGHELLDEIHVEDYVTQLKQNSDAIKKKLEEKGVSEVLVTELFAKVQKDISGGVHATLDDKLHIIEGEGKVLEEILRGELEKANKKANKNTEEIGKEVSLLMKEVKEHVVALHIHERLHTVNKIGIEIFMGLLLTSIFVEDFTEETNTDIEFTHLPGRAVALFKALSEKTLGRAIDSAFKGALKHFGEIHLSAALVDVCADKLGKTVDEIKALNTLEDHDIEKLEGLSEKNKVEIIYAHNQKIFTEGFSSSAKGVVGGVSDTLKAGEFILGHEFLELLTGSEETPTGEVQKQQAVTQIAV